MKHVCMILILIVAEHAHAHEDILLKVTKIYGGGIIITSTLALIPMGIIYYKMKEMHHAYCGDSSIASNCVLIENIKRSALISFGSQGAGYILAAVTYALNACIETCCDDDNHSSADQKIPFVLLSMGSFLSGMFGLLADIDLWQNRVFLSKKEILWGTIANAVSNTIPHVVALGVGMATLSMMCWSRFCQINTEPDKTEI